MNLDLNENFTTTSKLKRNLNPSNVYCKWTLDEVETSPRVVAIKMHFGKLKLNFFHLNTFHRFNTYWIDLKKLPYKLDKVDVIFPISFIKFGH